MKPSSIGSWFTALAIATAMACSHSAPTNDVASQGASSLADPSDPLANPPTFDDSAKGHEADIRAALDTARPKLKTLDRYKHWQAENEHYDARIAMDAKNHIVIKFGPPLVTDSDVTIEFDPATKTIVDIRQGVG